MGSAPSPLVGGIEAAHPEGKTPGGTGQGRPPERKEE